MDTTSSKSPLPIIYINGFPGTGKLTVAKELVNLINQDFEETWERQRQGQTDCMDINNNLTLICQGPPQIVSHSENKGIDMDNPGVRREARLIHNHLLIDPAGACLPRTSPSYQALRRTIREAIFNTLITSMDTFNTMYVFTDFQSGDQLGSSVVREYLNMAKARSSRMLPIIINCNEEENLNRLATSDRERHGKLVDLELAKVIRQSKSGIFRFEGEEATKLRQIDIDVTDLTAKDAALIILQHILNVCPELSP